MAPGHCHPKLVEALKTQGEAVAPLQRDDQRAGPAPGQEAGRRHLRREGLFLQLRCRSERSRLKLARRYAIEKFGAHKTQIIAFHQGFHGRTFFTVSSRRPGCLLPMVSVLPADITHVAYNNLEELASVISRQYLCRGDGAAAGEGGIIRPTDEFAQWVRRAVRPSTTPC